MAVDRIALEDGILACDFDVEAIGNRSPFLIGFVAIAVRWSVLAMPGALTPLQPTKIAHPSAAIAFVRQRGDALRIGFLPAS